jgi:ubiquinone/menaquinone biosynthesis C-methylase UbiE
MKTAVSISLAAGLMVVALGAWPGAQDHDHGQAPDGRHGAGTPQPDHMEHRFDNAEHWARSFDDPARDAWQMPDRVIEALAIKPGQLVADVGAGTGYFTVRLAKAAPAARVYGVDIEQSMVDYLRQRATREGLKNIVAIRAGSDRTNLPEPVDVVLVVDTYHHVPGRVGYFATLKKMMKPGGRLAIVDFRKDSPEGPPKEFRFSAEEISAELAKAGFSLRSRHDFLPRQMFLIYGAD